jgi:hypothetical protein
MTSFRPKVHKPPDCALLLAIPVHREEFLLELSPASNKDFAKHYQSRLSEVPAERLWDDHYGKQADRILAAARAVKGLHCAVKESCTTADFTASLERYQVVALVAHVISPGLSGKLAPEFDPRLLLRETKVEFADGLVDGEDFVNLIPAGFRGILDLRACTSVILGESLKSEMRGFLVIENVELLYPVIQVIAFQQTIATLDIYDRDYCQTSMEVRRELSPAPSRRHAKTP